MTQRFKKHFKLYFAAAFLLMVVFPMAVSAAQVTLQWDPNGSSPDGYNVYQRLDGHDYNFSDPLNSVAITGTTYIVKELSEGRTYRFVVRAFIGNDESGDSNEVVYTVPASNPDSDNDGYNDSVDAFPYDETEWQDTDGDGIGNELDLDDDGDGLPDAWEELYELDPLDGSDANGDLDGDGVSNIDEHRDGSDPSQVAGNSPPEQPTLVVPVDGAVGVDLMPTLMTETYVDGDAHAHSRTHYQIATSTDWDRDLVFEGEYSKQLTSATVGDLILDSETTYYWRVRFFDAHNGRSEWSKVFSFTTIDDIAAGFQDDDGDGILNDQEVAEGDIDPGLGNSDDMVVVGTTDQTNPQLSVLLSSNADIISLRSAEPDTVEVGSVANRPDVITGLISFKLSLLNDSKSADVTVNLSTPAPANAAWYKYNTENGWAPYTDVTFSSDRKSVTIHLVDGGPGDDDGVQNGVIVDPSGLGYSSAADSGDGDSGDSLGDVSPITGSGGGGGCFIAGSLNDTSVGNSQPQNQPAFLLLAGLIGFAAIIRAGCRK